MGVRHEVVRGRAQGGPAAEGGAATRVMPAGRIAQRPSPNGQRSSLLGARHRPRPRDTVTKGRAAGSDSYRRTQAASDEEITMPDSLHEIAIQADPQRVYDAWTTREGIRGWWTDDARMAS